MEWLCLEPILFFIHLRALPAWLALTREKRAEFSAQKLEPIFAKYPTVKSSVV